MFVGVSCGGEFWGLDVFRTVEELGYDGLFTGEHLLFHRPVWDAVTMCTAMACDTERIAIGPDAMQSADPARQAWFRASWHVVGHTILGEGPCADCEVS